MILFRTFLKISLNLSNISIKTMKQIFLNLIRKKQIIDNLNKVIDNQSFPFPIVDLK